MAQSSDEFHRLLQMLQSQHEKELAVLTQEVSRLQRSIRECVEIEAGNGTKPSAAIDPSCVDVVIAELSVDIPIDAAKLRQAELVGMVDQNGSSLSAIVAQRIPPLNKCADLPVPPEEEEPDPVVLVGSLNLQEDEELRRSFSGGRFSSPPSSGPIESQRKSCNGVGTPSSAAGRSVAGISSSAKRFKLFRGWHPYFRAASQRFDSTRGSANNSTELMQYHKTTSGQEKGKGDDSKLARLDRWCLPLMVDPSSKRRTFWNITSLVVLCYEIAITPPECFIGFSPPPFMVMMRWVSLFFWSLDIPFTFMVRVYNENGVQYGPTSTALHYLCTWLLFDVAVVGTDWFFVVLQETNNPSFVPIVRSIRLLRMSRLLRIARLRHIASELMNFAPDIVVGCAELLKVGLCIGISIHVLACCWFAFGTLHNGWASSPDVTNAPFSMKYLRALLWTMSFVHGTATSAEVNEPIHFTFSIFMVCFGFVSMALFVGKVTHTVMSLANSRRAENQQLFRNYLRTRKVSPKLQLRLYKYFTQCHDRTFKENVDRERALVATLPEFLQMGLILDVRAPLLSQVRFYREGGHRMIRNLCHEALTNVVALASETVFEYDVFGTQMLFVESGQLTYLWGSPRQRQLRSAPQISLESVDSLRLDPSVLCPKMTGFFRTILKKNSARSSFEGLTEILSRGAYLCEATLWTDWSHRGALVARGDATLLALAVYDLISVIDKMPQSITFTTNYARRFLIKLNQYERNLGRLSDLLDIEVDFSDIDGPSSQLSSFSHLAFLSHFKQEAGAEAALMEEYLSKIIREDPEHPANGYLSPCFLDSEDLTDLSNLLDHVRSSHNLIVLLTPEILSRPWCLIEIVTAVRNDINLVPVEIQRPGLIFQYPDEQFYDALSRGKTLTHGAIQSLMKESIDLTELTECVRSLFVKIALPFSPHKSTKIRQAEICDILARCKLEDLDDETAEDAGAENPDTLQLSPARSLELAE